MITAVRLQQLHEQFIAIFGEGKDVRLLRAPARINILGEHVDYVSYLPTASLPFGSQQHEMLMLFCPNEAGQVRGASISDEFTPFSFAVNEIQATAREKNADEAWTDWLYSQPAPSPHWSNYVKGAVWYAQLQHAGSLRNGFDFVIASTIPPKGGASSSSALVVLAGAAIRTVSQIPFTSETLARESSRAEWYVGTRGGALDHTAICLAREHQAVHLDYLTQEASLVALPGDRYCWVTFFSHEADKGKAVMLAYNERAAVARLLIPAVLNQRSLMADASGNFLQQLPETLSFAETEQSYPKTFLECRQAFPALVTERFTEPLRLRDRARHHFSEAQRVGNAVKLLRETFAPGITRNESETDAAMRILGALVNASHESLRDDYAVSTPDVEQLRSIILADHNVYGARLMGGGFGGNVLALTTLENAPKLIARVQRHYYTPQQRDGLREGAVMISTPGDGLREISPHY